MTEIIIFTLLFIFGIYRYIKTKSESLLCGLFLAASLFIVKKINLPAELGFSLWAFFGSGFLLYKFLHRKTDKFLYVFSLMLFGFGIIFLIYAIEKMGYEYQLFKFLRF